LLLDELEKRKDATEAKEKALKLRIFHTIVIANYLLPTNLKLASEITTLYTRDVTKIADYDWCVVVYEYLRQIIESGKFLKGKAIHGCITVLLVIIKLVSLCRF
jgi:hypothetical protein